MNELTRPYPGQMAGAGHSRFAPAAEEVGYYYNEQGDETHLRDYWNILRKRSRLIVTVFIDVLLVAILITLASPTLYTARSTLKIDPQNPTVTGVAGVGESDSQFGSGPYDYYQTQFALLKSQVLAARVIKALNLETNAAFMAKPTGIRPMAWINTGFNYLKDGMTWLLGDKETGPAEPRVYEMGVAPGLIGRYNRYLTVTPTRNTRLVDVFFDTPNAKLSQALANAHTAQFIQMILENRFSLTKEAKDFLGARLAELRDKVQKAEVKLNRFRQEHGVVSFEKGENIVVDRLVDLNRVLTKAKADRIAAESLYLMTRNKNTEYLSQVLSNPLILQIKGQLAGLETERGRLLSIFTPEHPRLQELSQQINEARRGLRGEVDNILRGIESSYAAARNHEESLTTEAKKQQENALSMKEVGVDYAVLNEEVVVNRGLYDNVLKRLHETNVANDLAASNMQVLQRAELSPDPTSPSWLLNMTIATILGMMLAVGLAFFLEYMDATVNTPQGVWSAVALTTLGIVPHLKSLPEKYRKLGLLGAPQRKRLEPPGQTPVGDSKEIVMARDQLSLTAESYRSIRTALLLSQAEQPPKVILLTSPNPEDGKTVTTVNLGIALAQAGQSVVVVDADLRKGRCHNLVNIPNRVGLANVLTGQAPLRNSIQPTDVKDFYVLTRGALPPNPADLLMSRKMREVVDELRASFDFVLIDSPPIIAVSDAAILSVLCNGVVMVFNGQKTTTQSARRATERLDRIGAPLLGVILNGVDMRNPDYVDYRSYYPKYYDAMQKEFRAKEREEWSIENAKDDGLTAVVADLDRDMESLGFPCDSEQDGGIKKTVASDSATMVVPRHFFEQMAAKLSEAIGSVAFSTVTHKVVSLRESMDAFPIHRAWELTKMVSQEIIDQAHKVRFLRAMSQTIRTLPTA